MNAWFTAPGRISKLALACDGWFGTPFSANGNAKGPCGGVSCQKLVAAIYSEIGFCTIDVPEVPMGHVRRGGRESLVEPFVAKLPMFEPVLVLTPAIGDLLGFNIGRIVHHLGIYCGSGFIHATPDMGVSLGNLRDITWANRLARVWRPIEL